MNTGAADPQSGARRPADDEDEEAEEQEHRAAVFRNSLFADAGEREWPCAICAFENRRVTSRHVTSRQAVGFP